MLSERDTKDKKIALNWFAVGVIVGLLISMFL